MKTIIRKARSSNIELLRIISMFMIMILHVNYTALGVPTVADAQNNALPTFTRIFFEMLSIGSVNAFVLISGWFGIKASWKSLTAFIFQCIFITWGIYVIMSLIGCVSFSLRNLDAALFVRSWFVQAYLGLYILTPALNLLIEHSKRKHMQVLIGLLLLEFVYDFLAADEMLFNSGYSIIHFVLLYLIARYIKLYGIYRPIQKHSLAMFFIVCLLVSIIQFIGIRYGITYFYRLGIYSSPAIMLAAICLLLTFAKLNFQSNFINKIATASFTVYLIHTNPFILPDFFMKGAIYIYETASKWEYLIYIFIYIAIWYVLAIPVDFIRQYAWKKLSPSIIQLLYGKRKLD